jgi:hypothetical protein
MDFKARLSAPLWLTERYLPDQFALFNFIKPHLSTKVSHYLTDCDSVAGGREVFAEFEKLRNGAPIVEIDSFLIGEYCALTTYSNLSENTGDLRDDAFGHYTRSFAIIIMKLMKEDEFREDEGLIKLIDSAHFFGNAYRDALIRMLLGFLENEGKLWKRDRWDYESLDDNYMRHVTGLIYLLSLDWQSFSGSEREAIESWYLRLTSELKEHFFMKPTCFIDFIPATRGAGERMNWGVIFESLESNWLTDEFLEKIRELLSKPREEIW